MDGPGLLLLLLLLGLGVVLVLGVWRHGGGGAVVRPGVRGVGVDLGVHCQQRLVRGRGGNRGVLNIAMREKYLGWTKIFAVEKIFEKDNIRIEKKYLEEKIICTCCCCCCCCWWTGITLLGLTITLLLKLSSK